MQSAPAQKFRHRHWHPVTVVWAYTACDLQFLSTEQVGGGDGDWLGPSVFGGVVGDGDDKHRVSFTLFAMTLPQLTTVSSVTSMNPSLYTLITPAGAFFFTSQYVLFTNVLFTGTQGRDTKVRGRFGYAVE